MLQVPSAKVSIVSYLNLNIPAPGSFFPTRKSSCLSSAWFYSVCLQNLLKTHDIFQHPSALIDLPVLKCRLSEFVVCGLELNNTLYCLFSSFFILCVYFCYHFIYVYLFSLLENKPGEVRDTSNLFMVPTAGVKCHILVGV